MTVLIVVFSEILPKTLAIARAEDVARAMSIPTLIVVKIFGPLAFGAQWIVRHTLRIFGIRMGMETDVLAAHEEIRGAVEYHHSEGLVESADRWMLGGVLDLSQMDVSEVMVHRRNPSACSTSTCRRASWSTLALDSAHTRLPLYLGDPDNIVGVLHAKDLLRALASQRGRHRQPGHSGHRQGAVVHPRHHQPEGPAQPPSSSAAATSPWSSTNTAPCRAW
jgi:Mg2+/Co2+ transporter CorB